MATTTLSSYMTDVTSTTIRAVKGQHGVAKTIITHDAIAGALADNSLIVLADIPTDARITSIIGSSDDLGDTGKFNIGFYPGDLTPADLVVGDAVGESVIALDIDVNNAALANVEYRFQNSNISTANDTCYTLSTLTAQPTYGHFWLALTLSQLTTAGGDIKYTITYLN